MSEPLTSELKVTAMDIKKVYDEAYDLFVDRNNHHDNIFLKHGVQGCIIRMEDKIHDVDQGGKPPDEDLYECLLDVANYALMAALCESRTKTVKKPLLLTKKER